MGMNNECVAFNGSRPSLHGIQIHLQIKKKLQIHINRCRNLISEPSLDYSYLSYLSYYPI